ncbi:putative armadillo repeat-containing kinesin-like protein 1 isoform X2 [Iris pallida]|uniref:Armadillo repeat-containing kinesin-like protein 1 isoform X2 n=1 Tax=Iris pallida TaxID=29817 RepID=A0AAX6H276_IRIPA|nr:putative armadillo repeat-containing kinesin-like protein 1 isoform X2 [Iris pallida]
MNRRDKGIVCISNRVLKRRYAQPGEEGLEFRTRHTWQRLTDRDSRSILRGTFILYGNLGPSRFWGPIRLHSLHMLRNGPGARSIVFVTNSRSKRFDY